MLSCKNIILLFLTFNIIALILLFYFVVNNIGNNIISYISAGFNILTICRLLYYYYNCDCK